MIRAGNVMLLGFLASAALASATLPAAQSPSALPSPAAARAPGYVPGEVLVEFEPANGVRALASAVASLGDRELGAVTVGSSRFAHVRLRPGRAVEAALADYAAMPGVKAAQPNYIYEFLAVPNDPQYGQLWGLNNAGQAVVGAVPATAVAGADMGMQRAWDRVTDCRSVIVAVLDSGVNYTHRDLAANMWDGSSAGFPHHGFDFADDDNDPMPSDALGHGNHVAGTIGAVGNNAIGVTGVCWRARIMAVRVGGRNGPTTAEIIRGMQFAVTHGAKVINLSLGGGQRDAAFEAEVEHARENGVVVVVAAGNSGTDNDSGASPLYPCNFPQDNLICVTALDQGYSRASFGNVGATSVDVGAPGVNILSAWPGATMAEDFTGWTLTGGWTPSSCGFSVGPLPILANPGSWCSSAGEYANNADDVAYKSFDLSATLHAHASFFRFLDTEPGADFLGVAKRAAGGDPFDDAANPAGVVIREVSGSTGGAAMAESVDLNDCRTPSCSVGFRLRSNASVTRSGAAIALFQVETAQANSNAYHLLNGTSMASPHVAGLAALVWSCNPAYTYTDVVNAVKHSGDLVQALAGVTATGRAVDADGALRYINPPTGVAVSVNGAP